MSSSGQWIVGYLEAENQFSVIPSKWLVSCGNIWISKWPKYGNVPELIKSLAEPGMDWPTYHVKIVSEIFNKYDEAILKKKQMFMAASTSESETKSYIQPVHNDSDTCISTPQSPINITPNKPKPPSFPSIKLEVDEDPPTPYLLNTNTIPSAYNCMYSMNGDVISEHDVVQSSITTMVDQNNLSMSIQNNMSTSTAYIDEQTSPKIKYEFDLSRNQNDIIQMMYINSIATLECIKKIDGKLETMISGDTGGHGHGHGHGGLRNTTILNILTQLPMKTISDVKDMETKFSIDDNFELELRTILQIIGGKNLKNFVKRSLKRLFTNELATKYTWCGLRQHEQLQTLHVIQVLKGVAINTFSSTEGNFEAYVKDWFRYGSLRYSREKN